MQWSEVFDKYFIYDAWSKILVFIPGSYTGRRISFAWTTIEDINNGLDFSSLVPQSYLLYGKEVEGPGSQFKRWEFMKQISQEERVCRKIRVMEERWKRFQEGKKAPKSKIRKTFTRVAIDYAVFDDSF